MSPDKAISRDVRVTAGVPRAFTSFDVSLGFGGSPRGINARGYIVVGDFSSGLYILKVPGVTKG